MNMNLNLNSLDMKKILPVLRKLQPYIFGVVLIGVFGYTAYEVNEALNVKPAEMTSAEPDPTAKVKFDKVTIEALKKLDKVEAPVPEGTFGKTDPFN